MNALLNSIRDKIVSSRLESPERAFRHAKALAENGRYVTDIEVEAVILQDWLLASRYAREITQARWPEFEAIVEATSTSDEDQKHAVYKYTLDILGGPWDAAERHIVTDPHLAAVYAAKVLDAPWEPGHPALAVIETNREALQLYSLYENRWNASASTVRVGRGLS